MSGVEERERRFGKAIWMLEVGDEVLPEELS